MLQTRRAPLTMMNLWSYLEFVGSSPVGFFKSRAARPIRLAILASFLKLCGQSIEILNDLPPRMYYSLLPSLCYCSDWECCCSERDSVAEKCPRYCSVFRDCRSRFDALRVSPVAYFDNLLPRSCAWALLAEVNTCSASLGERSASCSTDTFRLYCGAVGHHLKLEQEFVAIL